jgi:hypothetical protein
MSTDFLLLLRKRRIPEFLKGGSTAVLLVGLFGAVAFNALWEDDNKWRNLQFGRQRTTHRLAVSIVTLSLFAFLAVLGGLLASIILPVLRQHTIICSAVGYLLCVIVIALQGAAISYTEYAPALIPTEYNYREQYSEFASYLERHESDNTSYLYNFTFDIINRIRIEANLTILDIDLISIEPLAFFVTYRERAEPVYNHRAVTSCAFNWEELAVGDNILIDDDPCHFFFEDVNADCIGAWTPALFRDYWCELWTQRVEEKEFLAGRPGLGDIQKRKQIQLTSALAVSSVAAFCRHNLVLMSLTIAGFVVSLCVFAIDIWITSRYRTKLVAPTVDAEGDPR